MSSVSVRSLLFLSFITAHPCIKFSLDISSFLKGIYRLSHSIVFLYLWTSWRSNQSVLKEINTECLLEGLLLKLRLQYFGYLMLRTDLEKTLMLGKMEDRGRRGRQRMIWLDGITDLMGMSLSKFQEAWSAAAQGLAKSQTLLSNWTELTSLYVYNIVFTFCFFVSHASSFNISCKSCFLFWILIAFACLKAFDISLASLLEPFHVFLIVGFSLSSV